MCALKWFTLLNEKEEIVAIWKNNETAGVWETGAPSYGILLIDNFVRKPRSRSRLDFYCTFWKVSVLFDFISSTAFTGRVQSTSDGNQEKCVTIIDLHLWMIVTYKKVAQRCSHAREKIAMSEADTNKIWEQCWVKEDGSKSVNECQWWFWELNQLCKFQLGLVPTLLTPQTPQSEQAIYRIVHYRDQASILEYHIS